MNILIAEDQQIARMILADHLTKWGHRVSAVANGQEALDILLAPDCDINVLITDWSMPLMDGIELAQKVRSIASQAGYIYIILLTGRSEFTDLVEGFSEGEVDDYISKPYEPAELKLRLQGASRIIQVEKKLRIYNESLERLVRKQTDDIRKTQEEIISRLFNALESKDQETALHVRRIGDMSASLGTLLGWSEYRIDAIRSAAPLHDIGKIGIADVVLLKPGPLNSEEFDHIKQHASIGSYILSGSQNLIIQMGEKIAHFHHENWDGSGYPLGLKGDEIPIEAQIVAIADVYDALLADRIYRKGMPEEKVLSIIKEDIGRKFSPEIAGFFLENYEQIKAQYTSSVAPNNTICIMP